MPRVLARRVNPQNEIRLQAAISDWENGLFKSKRAAARAYDVSHVILLTNLGGCLCFRSPTRHCVAGSMGDVAGEKPTNPSNCSLRHKRQFCVTGSNSVP